MDDNSKYTSKLIDIANFIDYFLYEYSKKLASDFNWRGSRQRSLRKIYFFLVYA